jgi:hypothetical protein
VHVIGQQTTTEQMHAFCRTVLLELVQGDAPTGIVVKHRLAVVPSDNDVIDGARIFEDYFLILLIFVPCRPSPPISPFWLKKNA